MTLLAIIVLILLGLLLLLLEFAVIPGVTIAGIGGFVMLVASVYLAFAKFGTLAGIITLLVVVIAVPLLFLYFFKSKAGKKMILDTNIDATVDTFEADKFKPGDTGHTIGRLAPIGKVRINGEIVEAQSSGLLIDHNTDVRVVKVNGNKIIVETLKNE